MQRLKSCDAVTAAKQQPNLSAHHADLKGQTRTMGSVVMTVRLMPEGPDTDLHSLETEAKNLIRQASSSHDIRVKEEPIAFGLIALDFTFIVDEDKGSPDDLEKALGELQGVSSVSVTDVRRALG